MNLQHLIPLRGKVDNEGYVIEASRFREDSDCVCDYQDTVAAIKQAHRAGWAQCQRDAVKAAKYSHHPESCFCDWCAIAHKASDDVAAMTYKEPTNEK